MKENIVERQIMWGDLDALGIVFYPRYYEWIDACGHLYFESIGLELGMLHKNRALLFGLVETSCRYFKPGRYHQRIHITTRLEELSRKTLILKHAIHQSSNRAHMVEGTEHRICLDVSDPENLLAVDIPDDIYTILTAAMKDT